MVRNTVGKLDAFSIYQHATEYWSENQICMHLPTPRERQRCTVGSDVTRSANKVIATLDDLAKAHVLTKHLKPFWNTSTTFVYFRIYTLQSAILQYLLYGMFAWAGDVAGSLPSTLFQGEETYRVNEYSCHPQHTGHPFMSINSSFVIVKHLITWKCFVLRARFDSPSEEKKM